MQYTIHVLYNAQIFSDFLHVHTPMRGFPDGSDSKNPPAMQETWVPSLGWKDPLQEEMASQSSILAWRIPWTEESGGLQSMRSKRVWSNWAINIHTPMWTLCCCCSCSVTKSCLTLWDPMNSSTSGLPVHHLLPEFAQIHVHWIGDAIRPSHSLPPSSPFAFNLSQHQGLFQWVSCLH